MQSDPNYSQFDYHNQVYFNLENNAIVKENLKTNWDIGFESSENGWRVILNSAKFSDIVELEGQNFDDEITLSDINNLTKRWDRPEGINFDYGTAIGDYRNKNSVYVINRGYKLDGTQYDKKKLIIEEVNGAYYSIKYSDLNNLNVFSKTIYKNNNTNFQYFSFENNSIVDVEPTNSSWDLVFSQYTHLYDLTGPVPSYLVTGVLTNYLQNISVAEDTNYLFEEITANILNEFYFTDEQDKIGYNWKDYSLNTSTYIVNTNVNYIIKNSNNKYFKLRFIDFYNSGGQKGYPQFEFQEL